VRRAKSKYSTERKRRCCNVVVAVVAVVTAAAVLVVVVMVVMVVMVVVAHPWRWRRCRGRCMFLFARETSQLRAATTRKVDDDTVTVSKCTVEKSGNEDGERFRRRQPTVRRQRRERNDG